MQFERALVTGASTGIGRAIAIEFASRGTAVVLVARDESRLKALADELREAHGVDVEVLAADLTLPDDRERVEQRVADLPVVDCVVNNAGLGYYVDMAGSTAAQEQAQIEVNVTALTRLTQVAAQTFNVRRHGGILNVSSLSSFQPLPGHATYAAGKAFVTSLTQALREELRGSGVHVTVVCPGYTHTEFHDRADADLSGVPSSQWATAEDVARAGVEGLLANRAVVVPGTVNRVVALLSEVVPSSITRQVGRLVIQRAKG